MTNISLPKLNTMVNTWEIEDYCPNCAARTQHTVVKQRDNGYHVENARSCNTCGNKRILYTPMNCFRATVVYASFILFLIFVFSSCRPQVHYFAARTIYTTDTVIVPNPFPGDSSGAPDIDFEPSK